jgi:hypothetical protein
LKFLVLWWWVGLVTYPRIVLEAGKLFFRRKLHVWFRPEPLKTSIGRHAHATEQVLEASFRSHLRYLCFKAIQNLRRRPAPMKGSNTTTRVAGVEKKSDIRIFRLSAMDEYILAESTLVEQKYRMEVLKLFISDRIALGSVDLLKAELFLLKYLMAWALAGSLFSF